MRWLDSILPGRARFPWWAAAALTLLLLVGCRKIESWRGTGYTDADAEWGKKYRPPGPKGERFFFDDERAAQIERSLGL